jgi:predicted permease
MSLYTLRHAVRMLGRDRAFTATAVLTLSLGIGANIAIFAVIEAVMLRPLPYDRAGELVILNHRDTRTSVTKAFIAIGDFVDLKARQEAFEALGSFGSGRAVLAHDGEMQQVSVLQAGPGLLEALRVDVVAGRALAVTDSRPGAAPVALISRRLWEQQYRGETAAIGRTLRLGTVDRQIVGVLPAGFRFPADAATDIVVPAALPPSAPADRKSGWVFAAARLKPGVSLERANAHLAGLSRDMETAHPQSNAGSLYYAAALRDQWLGDAKRPLLLLLVAVAVVLLAACANVGNLLLARALARQQEMSVRAALGAGRARLVGQLVAESLTLTTAAGLAGALLAYWGVPALVALVPPQVSVPGLQEVGVNWRVLTFALALCGGATLVFAMLSSFTIRHDAGVSALTSQSRVAGGRTVRRLTSMLVVAEVALSTVLLIGAGLIVRTFDALLSEDPGFDAEGVALLDVALPAGRYPSAGSRQAFYDRAFRSLEQVAGVEAVGAAAVVPLTGNNWTVPFERADRPVAAGARPPDVGWQNASGGYFRAMRIPLLSGRLFDARDAAAGAAPVVIVSRSIERRYFGGESAVGRRVKNGDGEAEIVGVVGDIRRARLTDAPAMDMYFPFERVPPVGTTLFLKVRGPAGDVTPAAQVSLRRLEPGLLFREARTMHAVAAQSIASTRLALWLLGLFALMALALAAVGVYGVMSYVVRQRTREFGTRLALGATAGDILMLVLRQGAAMTLAGLGIGLTGGLVVTRGMSSLLHGVSSSDPLTVAAAVATLTAATMGACYVPARRAMGLDPARTLQGD